MSQIITIYRREDQNTTPRGFGNPPTYHIDAPPHSDADMIWVEPVQITLPDGYTVAESESGPREMYDPQGRYVKIFDDHGHPAIMYGTGRGREGKPFAKYFRLDKGAAEAPPIEY
ncbi:MAG TPA: hypothetical protein DEA44_16730 [Firmicutes bacterium]|nr:hypothetical protein [Bacillota bacterium]